MEPLLFVIERSLGGWHSGQKMALCSISTGRQPFAGKLPIDQGSNGRSLGAVSSRLSSIFSGRWSGRDTEDSLTLVSVIHGQGTEVKVPK